MYQVLVERSAEKDLKRLAAGIQARVVFALRSLAVNPRPSDSRNSLNETRLAIRVGDYRIIDEIPM